MAEEREAAAPSKEIEEARQLAARYRCEFVDLAQHRIDPDLFRLIPVDMMFRHHFIPLEANDGTLTVAMADPTQFFVADELAVRLGRDVVVKVATQAQIEDILKKTEQSQRVLEEATEGFRLDVVRESDNDDATISAERLTASADMSPVIRLVDSTLFNALERRASDIHIEARDAEVVVKYRIDGVLHPAMAPLAKEWHSTIISRIKVMSELDIAERRVPQDGRFRVRYKGRFIDFRVSIMPTVYGEDAVLRILDKQSLSEKFRTLNLDVIGFSEVELKRLRRYIREPYGMVLVTGPTGSGKTTTLYAAVSEIQSEEDKIITIEDPVEYQLTGITQIPVNEKKGLTFARGLRSILRHDPDKIMVGEIRDAETAQIAVQAALTGHLVFSTLHTKDTVSTPFRLLDMGAPPFMVATSLQAVLAQRLLRGVEENLFPACASCRSRLRQPLQRPGSGHGDDFGHAQLSSLLQQPLPAVELDQRRQQHQSRLSAGLRQLFH